MASDLPDPLRDDPMPENPMALAAEIRILAEARRKAAQGHPRYHKCTACLLRRRQQKAERAQERQAS
jgi:hypothetical protein